MNRAERRALARTGTTPQLRAVHHAAARARLAGKAVYALAMNQEPTEAQSTGLMLELYQCFDALKAGSTDVEHFNRLGSSLNTALVMAERIAPEAEDVIKAAHAAMGECDALHARHGRFGFTGPGMTAVADALALYAQIISLSTPRQILAAVDQGHQRMCQQVLAQRAQPQ